MYACALDQTGLLEMKCLPNLTGYVNTFTDELLINEDIRAYLSLFYSYILYVLGVFKDKVHPH